jgi:hypothetical protein
MLRKFQLLIFRKGRVLSSLEIKGFIVGNWRLGNLYHMGLGDFKCLILRIRCIMKVGGKWDRLWEEESMCIGMVRCIEVRLIREKNKDLVNLYLLIKNDMKDIGKTESKTVSDAYTKTPTNRLRQ